jgi:Domain of unknown function (DUF5658)
MNWYLAAIIFIIAAQVFDAVSTYLILKRRGYEKNPIAAKLMSWIGALPMLTIKIVLVSAFCVWLYTIRGHWVIDVAYWIMVLAYSYIVFNNTRALRNQ